MANNKTIKAVVETIKLCAEDLGIQPWQVQYNQFVKFAAERLGKDFNQEQVRIKEAGGFKNIKDAHFPPVISEEAMILSDLAKNNRKLANLKAKDANFLVNFEDILTRVFKKPIAAPTVSVKKPKIVERALHLVHSDNHIGAFLDTKAGTLKYTAVEASRRLASIGVQLADFKPQYRKNTKLYINSIGDLIDGIIHKKFKGYNLAEQVCMAVHYMIQWLVFLAPQFPAGIVVNCSTGNHDRIPEIHPDRATDDKSNSYATIVYYAVKKAIETAKIPNVTINIPRSAWIIYECFGANYFATHGDNVLNIGNPSSNLNIKSIETQINSINASLPVEQQCDVFMMGHVHTRVLTTLGNGVELIINPPLIPADEYAHSIGIFQSQTGQQLIESVPGYPSGDSRFLRVDIKTDSDASLDKIIVPFQDF